MKRDRFQPGSDHRRLVDHACYPDVDPQIKAHEPQQAIAPRNRPVFCLVSGGLSITKLDHDKPVGDSASSKVVYALQSKGYNVFPASECVYESTQAVRKVTLQRAEILYLHPFDYAGQGTFSVLTSYWGEFSVCDGNRLIFRRTGDNYLIVSSELSFIC